MEEEPGNETTAGDTTQFQSSSVYSHGTPCKISHLIIKLSLIVAFSIVVGRFKILIKDVDKH